MGTLLLLTAVAAAAAAAAPSLHGEHPSSLKYFGWYGDVTSTLDVTGPSSNLVQAATPSSAIVAAAAGQHVLLYVGAFFPTLHTANPDFNTSWVVALPELRELLANKTIFGFALGDELVWGGVTPANLVKYADTVRGSFPRGEAVIWYNEASFFSGPRKGWHNGEKTNVGDYTIPRALDWFSVDQYHMNGKVPGWAQTYVETWYKMNIYPNLTDDQQVMLVPGAFGSNVNHYPNGTFICDNACYDRMCAQDASDFYEWATSDQKVVAISPWNWAGCPECNGSRWTPPHTCCMDEIGAKDQPLTRAAWFHYGAAIKKSAVDDDDFGSAVSVSSKDGLRFDFAGTSVSGVSIGGAPLGPPDPKFTGFEVADFMNPASPKDLGPELLRNSHFTQQAGANASTAAGWTPGGAPHTDGFIQRVSNVSRQPGGFSLMAVNSGEGSGAYQRVTFTGSSATASRLVLSGWSKAVGVTAGSAADYALYMDLMYQDGSHLYAQVANYADGTHDWQRVQNVISVTKPLKLASVYLLLRGTHNGTAYFTDISLKTAKGGPAPTMLTGGTAKVQPDGTVRMAATSPAPTSLAVDATFEGLSDCIRVTGSITRTDASTANDRAVSVGLVLPLDATGWSFPSDLDSNSVLSPIDDASGLQYQNNDLPFATDLYPFLSLHNGKVGISAGVAVDGPVFVSRVKYTAARKGLSVTADFALTDKSANFNCSANFSFVFFKLDTPKWGFRAALQKYYGLFPAFSENVIKDQGMWLVAVGDVDTVENHSDFGFKFDEGGGSPADCRSNVKAGVGIFPYIEPHLVHWTLPRSTPIDYEHIMASVHACVANTTCTQLSKARSVLSAGVIDALGRYRFRSEDAAWNFGCVFWVDLDPAYLADPHSPVALMTKDVQHAYTTAEANNYTLSGIYMDSVANAQDLVNYDPARLSSASFPPLFDKNGQPVVLMLQNTLAFLLYLNREVLLPHNGLLMGNGPYYPETQYRFAPIFAVSGGETFWYHPEEGQGHELMNPTSHELLALHRVMAYQRPYLPLQDSNFFEWTYNMSSDYHQIELTFGMWPGYFSGDAAGSPYFRNATWYNRDRDLFQRYIPILKEINSAGWEPLTSAVVATASPPAVSRVWIERFGPNRGFVYFTMRNEGRPDLVKSLTVNVDGKALGIEPGKHTVTEMTRKTMQVVVTSDASGALAIVLDSSSLGEVSINETVVIKIGLKAEKAASLLLL